MVEENFIKRLMTSVKCGVCGQQYGVDNVSVLGHQEELWFLRASCSACHTQCLMAAIIKQNKMRELVTDLTEAELDKFRNVGVPTADDMLEMHDFFKDFNGDFSRLFSQK